MVLGIVSQEDLAAHALEISFGTICLVAAGVLRILGNRG
jgi:hypothetical protein